MFYKIFFTSFVLFSILFLSSCESVNPFNDLVIPNNDTLSTFEGLEVSIGNIGSLNGTVYQGQHVEVPISVKTDKLILGFDFLIGYDASALSFQSAAPGQSLVDNGWEYFTYRYGNNADTTANTPTGLLRLTAIAETNNGPNHPTQEIVTDLVDIDFLVTNDRTYECQLVSLKFYWLDCGDNTIYNPIDEMLYLSNKVYDPIHIIPDYATQTNYVEYHEIQNIDTTYPTYLGTQEIECDSSIHISYMRQTSFYNGSVQIYCIDIIDTRGDINLNSIANEIADAVLFSNYFVYGISAFSVNVEGQTAASDVNSDEVALSVADFVYLVHIIVGDALPYPALAPDTAMFTNQNGRLSIDKNMGAVQVVLDGNATFELLADNMSILSNYNDTNTYIFIYSLEGNLFTSDFLSTTAEVISIEFGSSRGATVVLNPQPLEIQLGQNYPNPFTDSTMIPFSIPREAEVTLTVQNSLGRKIFTETKSCNAGESTFIFHANGLHPGEYRYTISAENVSKTKSMLIVR